MAPLPPDDPRTDRERVGRFFHDPDAYERTRFLAPAASVRAAASARTFAATLPGAVDARHVLEVGAGTGRYTRLMLHAGFRVTAVDLSSEMVGFLGRHLAEPGRCRVLRSDAFALPFGAATFDAAVCMGLIGRFDDAANQMAVLAELSRVVRPGGWLVFDMRNPRSAISRWRGKGGIDDAALRARASALGFVIEARRTLHAVSGGVVRGWPSALARVVAHVDRAVVRIPGMTAHNVLYRARRAPVAGG